MIDAIVARITSSSTTPKMPATSRSRARTNRSTTPTPVLTPTSSTAITIWVRRYSRFTSVIQTMSALDAAKATIVHPSRKPEFPASA